MFACHTRDSIIALACIDKGVTEHEKQALVSLLSGQPLFRSQIQGRGKEAGAHCSDGQEARSQGNPQTGDERRDESLRRYRR